MTSFVTGVKDLKDEHVHKYLLWLGMQKLEPSIDYLFELHRVHVERISWQTIDIFYGRPIPIDIHTSIDLLLNGRSGYCFHLNGAFSQLLHAFGFSSDIFGENLVDYSICDRDELWSKVLGKHEERQSQKYSLHILYNNCKAAVSFSGRLLYGRRTIRGLA
jgi:hypothetical protein